MARRTPGFMLVCLTLPLLSCGGGGGGHAPVARFTLAPRFICAGDGNLTVVTMDASLSSDPIDDPPEKALMCSSDTDCSEGRKCTGASGADTDGGTGAGPGRLCLFPLAYAWSVEDEDFIKTDGDLSSVKLAGTFMGAFPTRVTLMVTDRDGVSSSVTSTLGVTALYEAPCGDSLDCPQGYLCADPLGKGAACYANCEFDENVCSYCPEEGAACARCYLCHEEAEGKLCLPAR